MSDTLSTLAAALMEAREAKAQADEALKAANAAVREAEGALFSALVDSGLEKITHEGYTFALDTKTYYGVAEGMADEFHEVMESLGRGSIFKYSVHYQTLNATLRELVAERGELPEAVERCVRVYDEGKVAVRKAARKG